MKHLLDERGRVRAYRACPANEARGTPVRVFTLLLRQMLFFGDVFASLHRAGMDGYAFPVMKGLHCCGGVPNIHVLAHEMLGGAVPVLEHFEMAVETDFRRHEVSQLVAALRQGLKGISLNLQKR